MGTVANYELGSRTGIGKCVQRLAPLWRGKGEGPLGKGAYPMNKTRGMQFWKAAMRYYPEFSRSTAVRRFREEIHNTPELLEELKRLGYDEHRRYFPPEQMAVIIKYLGD